jgi:Ca2+/H+ antiporter
LVGFSAIWNHFGSSNILTTPGKHVGNLLSTGLSLMQMTPTEKPMSAKSEFTLVFPKWEFYTIIFAVFLRTTLINVVTYVYLEGKSNYFKGALLLLSYFVLIAAFFFEPSTIY